MELILSSPEVETEVEKCFEDGARDRGADGGFALAGCWVVVVVLWAVVEFELARKRDCE